MQLRKLFSVAAAGLCLAFGAAAQTDSARSSTDSGATSSAKTSKKKSSRKSSKTSKSKSSKSSKSSKKKKTKAPVQQAVAVPDLPVPDDGEAPQLTHEAVLGGSRGKPLTVAAHAIDANGVYGPVLYVRKLGM